jgi:hypothetical protein
MRGAPRGVRRSVDRGTHRPAIEPRKSALGCRRRRDSGRQYGGRRHREPPDDPTRSETLACPHAPCAGTGRSRGRPQAEAVWSASGRHCAVADDVRSREVGLCHSSDEPRERWRATVGGGRGDKGIPAMAAQTPLHSSLARTALRRHSPEVGAWCENAARRVLCGGCAVTRIPTATTTHRADATRFLSSLGDPAHAETLAQPHGAARG